MNISEMLQPPTSELMLFNRLKIVAVIFVVIVAIIMLNSLSSSKAVSILVNMSLIVWSIYTVFNLYFGLKLPSSFTPENVSKAN